MSETPGLAALLRSWRARVQPEEVSSPFARGSRKTPGLRREEVAWLAGVSPDYVKRLEQGRAHPSAGVLRAISRALRLSDVEYELACRLAGHAAELYGLVPQHIGPSVQRLLDRLADTPIAVFEASWTRLEQNDLWTALTGDVRGRAGRPANIVWRIFNDDYGRVRHPFPDGYKASLVADLRDVASRYPADRELSDMITALRRSNPEFAHLWKLSTVAHHGNERKAIDHPDVGELELDCDVLSVDGADLRIIVFTAAPGSEAADKLSAAEGHGCRLTAWHGQGPARPRGAQPCPRQSDQPTLRVPAGKVTHALPAWPGPCVAGRRCSCGVAHGNVTYGQQAGSGRLAAGKPGTAGQVADHGTGAEDRPMAEGTFPRAPGDLTGRVAVITGAARGIGRAAAVALARRGAAVAGIDIAGPVSPILDFPPAEPGDLEKTGHAVQDAGGRWLCITADQRDIGAVRSAADRIEREWAGADIVFANAGIQAFKPILEMDDRDWHDQIDVNLNGTANVLRVFAPLLVRRGGGRIIITSSTQGEHGTKSGSSYSASKWGLIGLMKSAALELGSYGITVNAVIPGLIDTTLTRHEDRYAQAISSSGQEPAGDLSRDEETAKKLLTAKSPLGVPWIDPADVAPVVAFLASDEARMVSGASFAVTAGDSANITA